jgi:putative serine protease PepD
MRSGRAAAVRAAAVRAVAVAAAAAAAVAGALTACGPGPGHAAGLIGDPRAGFAPVVSFLLPSVVEISSAGQEGSGVVFDTRGDIVTNAHVVGKDREFEVRVAAASEPLPARLVGVFAPDDLAVIRVTRGESTLRPARWASPEAARVGAIVLALGSPYGLTDSVTLGVVSATGRTVTGPTGDGRPPAVIADAIQTSAPINPGNSGGALALTTGAVLGIPTLSMTDPNLGRAAPGIGFAIPSTTVRDIAAQLISSGQVTRPDRASLQITGRDYTTADGKTSGVIVNAAQPGGAAARAGIVAGDIIVSVNGRPTSDLAELEAVLIDYQPGAAVKVEALRNGSRREETVTLGTLSS